MMSTKAKPSSSLFTSSWVASCLLLFLFAAHADVDVAPPVARNKPKPAEQHSASSQAQDRKSRTTPTKQDVAGSRKSEAETKTPRVAKKTKKKKQKKDEDQKKDGNYADEKSSPAAPVDTARLRKLFPNSKNINADDLQRSYEGFLLLKALEFLKDFINLESFFEQAHAVTQRVARSSFGNSRRTDLQEVEPRPGGREKLLLDGNNKQPTSTSGIKKSHPDGSAEGELQGDHSTFGLFPQQEDNHVTTWFVVISRAQLCLLNNYLSWIVFGPLVGYHPLEKPLIQFVFTLDEKSFQYCLSVRKEIEDRGYYNTICLQKDQAQERVAHQGDPSSCSHHREEEQEQGERRASRSKSSVEGGGSKTNKANEKPTVHQHQKLLLPPPNVGQENRKIELHCVPPWSTKESGHAKTSLGSRFFNRVNWIRPALTYVAVFALRFSVLVSDVDIVHTRFPWGPHTETQLTMVGNRVIHVQNKVEDEEHQEKRSKIPESSENAVSASSGEVLSPAVSHLQPQPFHISRYLSNHIEKAFAEQDRTQGKTSGSEYDDWMRNRYSNAGFLFAKRDEYEVLADWFAQVSDTYYDQHGLNYLLLHKRDRTHGIHDKVGYFDPLIVCACRDACHNATVGMSAEDRFVAFARRASTHYSCDGRERFKREDMAKDGLWQPRFSTETSECGYTGLPQGVAVDPKTGEFVLETVQRGDA
ncbi:unnamed protein product [Amoebophrya sp. A120]|nr:unnamed protein product [Amoebophrya sp. A120]|eukprot:GSA120T00020391001.1